MADRQAGVLPTITMRMLKAGMRALDGHDVDPDNAGALVARVYWAMDAAKPSIGFRRDDPLQFNSVGRVD
ncbi:MAG: hypothetical protein H0X36_08540 [Sphingomonadaceae bacterium]|nr:hypothetical protein [Sphingomonadaceae bacterium]